MKTLLMIINCRNDWKRIPSICQFAVYYSPLSRSRSCVSIFCQPIVSKLSGVVCSLFPIRKSTRLSFTWLPCCSFRKIKICNFCNLRNGALLNFWLKLFAQKSSLHRVVSPKCVLESEEITHISSRSSKNSFRKLQIFEFTNSALPLFHSLFGLSHGGIWLLWYLICSFEYEFFPVIYQNTVIHIFSYCQGNKVLSFVHKADRWTPGPLKYYNFVYLMWSQGRATRILSLIRASRKIHRSQGCFSL